MGDFLVAEGAGPARVLARTNPAQFWHPHTTLSIVALVTLFSCSIDIAPPPSHGPGEQSVRNIEVEASTFYGQGKTNRKCVKAIFGHLGCKVPH